MTRNTGKLGKKAIYLVKSTTYLSQKYFKTGKKLGKI